MTRFDLRGLADALTRRGVDYIVVGGVAVAAHGYVRATRDLDMKIAAGRPQDLADLDNLADV